VDQLGQLVERAKKGDTSALPALRAFLVDPGIVDKLNGDLARVAQQSLVNAAAGEDLAFREALLRKLEVLRAELAGSDPTPVEQLLVQRVVGCWLQLHHADALYVQGQPKFTIVQDNHYQRCMDRAHKRYLSAIKTLMLVRKLALPMLQVNIAQKQHVKNA
jgi:hypothetical protein